MSILLLHRTRLRHRGPVIGPGFALASLVVGLNLFTEGVARILGRTVRLGAR
jgi:ABC-type dipeptide/oligopeptide/nickel transport system permease subunit